MEMLEIQHKMVKASNLDINKLLEIDYYRKFDCAWFFSSKDQNYELSNMAGKMPIVFKGHVCNSSEQLYQASKYAADAECIPMSQEGDPSAIRNVQERIFASKNAMGSKMTQKCAVKAELVRKDWMDVELNVAVHSMLWVLELKFIQNEEFRDVLLATKGPVVEKSRKDNFWGCYNIGPLKDRFIGKNVLGKLLTIVRDEKSENLLKGIQTYDKGFLL